MKIKYERKPTAPRHDKPKKSTRTKTLHSTDKKKIKFYKFIYVFNVISIPCISFCLSSVPVPHSILYDTTTHTHIATETSRRHVKPSHHRTSSNSLNFRIGFLQRLIHKHTHIIIFALSKMLMTSQAIFCNTV